MKRALFFDMDGTLLPIDMDEYFSRYLHAISDFAAPYYSYDGIKAAILDGYKYMLTNVNPATTAQEKFFERFFSVTGLDTRIQPVLESFYQTGYDVVEKSVRKRPQISASVRLAKPKGYRLILACNPVLPEIALNKRILWAGLDRGDFEFVSLFEEMHFCKPNLEFFSEILKKTALAPEDCVMIGNDAQEDLISRKLGFDTFYCNEFGVNRSGEIPGPSGGYDELYRFIQGLPEVP